MWRRKARDVGAELVAQDRIEHLLGVRSYGCDCDLSEPARQGRTLRVRSRALVPTARQVLSEMDYHLLLNSGTLSETGIRRSADGGVSAAWELSWPEQRKTGIPPIGLYAFYGAGWHHPHLRGGTVHDWPLNVFSVQDSNDQLCILRAIASGDLHNLVFMADYRIIPAVMRPPTVPPRST
jgi:hypothetical protein